MPIELVPAGTQIDFIGKRRLCAWLSIGVLLASLLAIPWRGVRLGIDFAGGTEIQVQFDPGSNADEGQIRQIVSGMPGVEDLSVVRFGDVADREFLLKFRAELDPLLENAGAAAPDAAERPGPAEPAAGPAPEEPGQPEPDESDEEEPGKPTSGA